MVRGDRSGAVAGGHAPDRSHTRRPAVGVQVIGPYLSDRRLLQIAGLLDTAAGPGFTPPSL